MISDTEPPSHDGTERPSNSPAAPKQWRPANPAASFRHAANGVTETFRAERNFRFHCAIAVLALAGSCLLHFSALRMVAVVILIATVLITELMNTAVEAAVDLAMPRHHPLAKRAKDAAAGAVLVSAVGAVAGGAYLFVPALSPLLPLLPLAQLSPVVCGAGTAVLFSFLVLLARRFRRGQRFVSSAAASAASSPNLVLGMLLATLVAAGVGTGAIPAPGMRDSAHSPSDFDQVRWEPVTVGTP